MTSTFQFWDETNSAILFDCYDSTGANASDNGYSATFLAGNPDFGTPGYEFERFSPPQSDGGSTTFKRMGLRTMTVPLMIRASTYDNYATAVGRLAQLCYNGGVIKWIPDGSARTLYIDFEPSPAPFFLDGRPTALVEAVRLFGTGTGITLTLTVQPTFRGAELDSAGNLFTNATLLRDADGGGRPDGWTWSSTSNISNENIDATAEAFEFDMAVSGANRSLTNSTAAASAAVGQDWTVSGYVRVSSSTMTNARAQAMLTWRTSAPADISTITSTLTALTSAWQRFSISGTAPATTDRIQGGMRFNNTSATSATIQMKNLQVEMTTTAQPFRVGSEVGVIDPRPSSGMGRIFPIYNPGDAPAPFVLTMNNTTSGPERGLVGFISDSVVEYLNTGGACLQIEDWTNGTDTLANTSANSSDTPGSSADTGKKTTFATTALTSRASYTLTDSTTLSALRGRSWLVVMRVAPADASYNGAVYFNFDSAFTSTLTATATAAVSAQYYDLLMGVVTFPADASWTSQNFSVGASRTSGSGNLIWDCITFVPAPNACYIDGVGSGVTASDLAVSDPTMPGVFRTTSAGVMNSVSLDPRGPTPLVAPPGLSAVYSLWTETNTAQWDVTEFRDALTNVLSFRSKFKPRYLT